MFLIDMDGCTEDDVRLMNGSNETVGRVEVCKRGTWGSVCKKYFEVIDAKIVCRQLGLQEEGKYLLTLVTINVFSCGHIAIKF